MLHQKGETWLLERLAAQAISPAQFATVSVLRSKAWEFGEPAVWVSQGELARLMGMTRPAANRHLKALRSIGLIKLICEPQKQRYGVVFNPAVLHMGEPRVCRQQQELWDQTVDPLTPADAFAPPGIRSASTHASRPPRT